MTAAAGPGFKARSDAALADATLKIAIDRTTGTAERKRAAALAKFPDGFNTRTFQQPGQQVAHFGEQRS